MVVTHFYDLATGQFTGAWSSSPNSDDPVTIPAGCGAFESASVRGKRLDLQTGELVDYRPPMPEETDRVGWAWDPAAGAWSAQPKLPLLQDRASEPVLAQLAQLDLQSARPVGEIALAQALGEPPPSAAVARLQSINTDKQALRQRLAAIAAAASADALAQLLATDPTSP